MPAMACRMGRRPKASASTPAIFKDHVATVDDIRAAHLQAWRDGWGPAFPSVWQHHVRELDEAG